DQPTFLGGGLARRAAYSIRRARAGPSGQVYCARAKGILEGEALDWLGRRQVVGDTPEMDRARVERQIQRGLQLTGVRCTGVRCLAPTRVERRVDGQQPRPGDRGTQRLGFQVDLAP